MSDHFKDLVQLITNPIAIQRAALSALEDRLTGNQQIVSATGPFPMLMEVSANNSAAAVIRTESALRRAYPRMALDEREIYNHMSDSDYVGRFATPARTKFRLLFSRNEVLARAQPTVSGVRKLTIPRNTFFEVAGYRFTMQYPIDIRVMSYGGIQIIYDTEITSPLEQLSSNVVEWSTATIDGVEWFVLDVPVSQFTVSRYTGKAMASTTFRQTIQLREDYYYARVYYNDRQGVWREMITTHSGQVFDPFRPTALLRVEGQRLTVEVPTVYMSSGTVTDSVRIDVYTTRGEISLPLTGYSPSSIRVEFADHSSETDTPWVAQMKAFTERAVLTLEDAIGGTGALTFEQLRDRVINSAMGAPDLPITNAQIGDRLARRGYSVVTDIDQVTNRQFLATRLLPTPSGDTTIPGSGSTILTLQATMQELASHTHCVMDNGNRLTILPDALYAYRDGLISIVDESTIGAFNSLPVDVKARRINEGQYLYSPFHYVLDISNDRFDLRGYYLDSPEIVAKSFIAENDTTGIGVSVAGAQLTRVDGGYMLMIAVRSGDVWKGLRDDQAILQLAYRPAGETAMAYQNGFLSAINDDMERVYTFFLGTRFDLDARNNLVLNTFDMFGNGNRDHAVALEDNFELFFVAADYSTADMTTSDIDGLLGEALLPPNVIGLTHERLRLSLGKSLDGLWSGARSVVGSEDYLRYSADVPWTYEKDVLELVRDPVTQEVSYNVLHRAGDVVLDQFGEPTYRYRVGDIQVDPEGKPIAVSSRRMIRQVDLYLMDGVYWFANDQAAMEYRETLPSTVVTWLETDIADMKDFLLEQTDLYLYSQTTLGAVRVNVGDNKQLYIDAPQSLRVEYSVTGPVFRDGDLRLQLERLATRIIQETLQKPVIRQNEIVSRITSEAGQNIIAVRVSGLGGSADYPVVTMVDDASRLSIRRKAVDKADGTITVRNDLEISFVQHTDI